MHIRLCTHAQSQIKSCFKNNLDDSYWPCGLTVMNTACRLEAKGQQLHFVLHVATRALVLELVISA